MKASPITHSLSREYKILEGISSPPIATTLLKNLWQWFKLQMTRGQDIQIWRVKVQYGYIWRVHDPRTNSTLSFSDEAEVRSWIEQRYSR